MDISFSFVYLHSKVKLRQIMAKKNQLTTADPIPFGDYQRLVESLHKDRKYKLELYARLAFCTGCRASDVLRFRWSDIIKHKSHTVTEIKTGKTRKIAFSPSVQEKITELYNALHCPNLGEYIFKAERSDEPVSIQYLNRQLKEIKREYRIKCDNFSTHSFRKTFGRYVYEKNNKSAESLILLNQIFKHSSIEITKIYLGISQDEINSVFNSIQF